jgi:hypothetical protein
MLARVQKFRRGTNPALAFTNSHVHFFITVEAATAQLLDQGPKKMKSEGASSGL